jgi:uncharacterized repeat protein (TIGR03837 family)
MERVLKRCDIFCAVVDNYGDIGVCWRLARQLAYEFHLSVRLWVDDLASFRRLCPEVDATATQQLCRGVEVRHWGVHFPEVEPAELVIEAFACELPERYVEAMAACADKPVWLNLEYLSAEPWVEGCHAMPSPHPRLPLVKYFYFPGFTPRTGGLLLESGLLAQRDAFQNDPAAQVAYWQSFGLPSAEAGERRISLFAYENPAVTGLLDCWANGATKTTCLVPEGRILPQVAAYFGDEHGQPGTRWQRGNLVVHVLPFVEQERYDTLLWACDINFVRGEDSCVRAQWAGRPFVWHIYPQHDAVHLEKLGALADLYGAGLTDPARASVRRLWQAWNTAENCTDAWAIYAENLPELCRHAPVWTARLEKNNLALNLLDFSEKVGKMRRFNF